MPAHRYGGLGWGFLKTRKKLKRRYNHINFPGTSLST